MAVKDYYHMLGIERTASSEEVKNAYRKMAMEYHPDLNQDKPGCEERLKEINEAYGILGDEGKRRQYDLVCGQPYDHQIFYGQDMNDDLVEIIRVFTRGGFGMRGFGGCKGRGFGRKGRRWRTGGL